MSTQDPKRPKPPRDCDGCTRRKVRITRGTRHDATGQVRLCRSCAGYEAMARGAAA